MAPIVSVMMPAYNAAPFVGQAIESLLAQTFTDWELIVVDDGSTDETADVVARFVEDPRQSEIPDRGGEDSRIQLLRQANGGESSARNRALEAMAGRYVAFLDADDLYHPDHLERTVGCLEARPDLDAVYTDGDHCDETGRLLKSLSSRRRGPFEGNLFEPLVWGSDVFGPPLCVVLRRERVLRRGLRWDPAIVIGPDWDFFIRYTEHATFGYIAERTCVYRVHASNVTVLTGVEKRRASLALCREKSLRLPGFADCSVETRAWVFYDLLVLLLAGQPERQSEIIEQAEFRALPPAQQARLLRLMAGQAIQAGAVDDHIAKWLEAASRLDGSDPRTLVVTTLYRIHPRVCQLFLRTRAKTQPATARREAEAGAHPLADLLPSPGAERKR